LLDALRRYRVKGKFLLFAIAMSLPLCALAQDSKPAAAPAFQRYDIFAGGDYSSANQVKGSSALKGFNVGGDAKLKPWFGVTADYGQYMDSTTLVKPTMTTFLAGPSVYLPSEKLIGSFHVMFGGAHTANVSAVPDVSFAVAIGGGFEYAVHRNWYLHVSGDGILSSFVLDPNHLSYSPNLRVNPRASLGIAYHF
jgi:hypothetical protein